ncbi:hypothetical protein MAPG_04924 [Magnaporthiopsis poae ATCC 64411]|uniref:Hypervirulence associated protein TUDOR domain-containing protein n=1 Tax=Magnaporthiopsis poae (strain ATCC 64411 / 73-15) TaxID=644358 RepID=A0A0C4DY15_MAGP6|nr:hypothetical protein MAPG_04924 [Magnaporthiopsis poae ATCC 64411]
MKDRKDVISEFNELVNMTASELEEWLKSGDSNNAGWPKGEAGESVGHDSGRKIADILKANPDKKADQYSDEDVEHMRKVVAYCKRHLAQEKGPNSAKSEEEVKKTKSYASLKNWGHDFLKGQAKETEAEDGTEEGADDGSVHGDEQEPQPGEKRKTRASQAGAEKRQETEKGASGKRPEYESEHESEQDDDAKGDEKQDGAKQDEQQGDATQDKTADQEPSEPGGRADCPEKGDTVSWKWGGGHPEGKVLDVKEEKTTITTKNGNKVSRDGSRDNPAVVLDAGSSKAIKLAHELD